MEAFEIADLLANRKESEITFHEFLKVVSLSAGIYSLPAGRSDPQHPHAEDEVYYVIKGKAQIRVAAEDRPVSPGSIVYVAAGVEHRFHTIEEDMTILVFFAPSEGSLALKQADP